MLVHPLDAWPHGYAGDRIFPATLAIEDPFAMDEFSLLADRITASEGDEDPPAIESTSIIAEYTARIASRFGMLFGVDAQIPINQIGGSHVGVLALFHVFMDDVLDEMFSRSHRRLDIE